MLYKIIKALFKRPREIWQCSCKCQDGTIRKITTHGKYWSCKACASMGLFEEETPELVFVHRGYITHSSECYNVGPIIDFNKEIYK